MTSVELDEVDTLVNHKHANDSPHTLPSPQIQLLSLILFALVKLIYILWNWNQSGIKERKKMAY